MVFQVGRASGWRRRRSLRRAIGTQRYRNYRSGRYKFNRARSTLVNRIRRRRTASSKSAGYKMLYKRRPKLPLSLIKNILSYL